MKTLRNGAFFLVLTISVCAAQVGAAQKVESKATLAAASQDSTQVKLSVDLLSDVSSADRSAMSHYIPAMVTATREEWMKEFPSEAQSPTLKQGNVTIEFVLLTDGKVTHMMLAHGSGNVALDRAAWGAIISAVHPAFPQGASTPQLNLRFRFSYNEGGTTGKSS